MNSLTAPLASAQYKDYAQQSSSPQQHNETQTVALPHIPGWMSLEASVRGRTEGQTAVNSVSGNGHAYELTHLCSSLEVRPLPWLNGYAQSVDAHALGMPWQYTTSSWKDNFDLHQAFLEFHMRGVAVFAGRQELKFGGERLVVLSDWANVGRSFDGFAAKFGDRNRITLFTASVVKNHPTSFDNHVGGLNFHGLFASFNTWLPHTSIEPYVYVRALPSVLSQQGIYGTETETTPGLRFLANAPLGFDVIAEAALQRGSYSNDSIHAGAGYIKTGYTARSLAWRPRLMGEYSYATGNPHRNPQRISTFDQLYPTSHNAFGLVDLFGWQNIRLERVHLDVSPSARLSLLLQREYVQVATRRDNVYAENGTVFAAAPANGFAREQLGRGFDISMKYQMTQFVAMTAGAAHFSPGALMNEAGYGAPLTFGYLSFTYRIRIARDKQAPNF